jgi:twitching motility protein PilT
MKEDFALIEAALNARFLTRKQAEIVKQTLLAGERAGDVMLSRHYVTPDQLTALLTEIAGGPPAAPPPAAAAAPVAAAPPSPPPPPPPPAAPAQMPKTLLGMLAMARSWGASDLHISSGRPPFVRIAGQIRFIDDMGVLTPERAEELNFSALTDRQREFVLEAQAIDFSLDHPRAGRFRCNVFRQRLGWDGAYRIIRSTIPTMEELGLPPVCKTLTEYHQGMVLVTGGSGSGKTTTCAAMLNYVNHHRDDHIITVEDPIEYLHRPAKCQVTLREVGRHTESFAKALRAALREDPDIILVGELRDRETISIAISAAETGHLVFGSLHTSSAARTVARILDVFPPAQQQQICIMVSESIRGIIAQQLVPRKDGTGLVGAFEVLLGTTGVAQLIREGKTYQLTNQMQSGKRLGMRTMEDSLRELYDQGLITGMEAWLRADNKEPFEAIKNS